MARKTPRPVAPWWCSSSVLVMAYGLVALAGTWKPELGLDLRAAPASR